MPALKRRHASAKQDLTQFSPEHDWDIAQAVGHVVQDLVAQVADEPYGELNRKRPAFTYVLRKFVRDSVQAFNEDITDDWIVRRSKKVRMEEEHELPYGIELVWGTILAEMEKERKKERAREYHHQKAIRKREQKKLDEYLAQASTDWSRDILEADQSTSSLLANVQLSGSSEEDIEHERPPPHMDTRHRSNLTAGSLKSIRPSIECKRIVPTPPSPRSDDSDWAEPKPKKTPMVSRVNSGSAESNRNFPIFNQPRRGRGSRGGRGRPRGGAARVQTEQSINEPKGDFSTPHKSSSDTRVLRSATKSMRVEPDKDFTVNMLESDGMRGIPPRDPFWNPSLHRGPVDPADLRLRLERYKECMEETFVLPPDREEDQWRGEEEWERKVATKREELMKQTEKWQRDMSDRQSGKEKKKVEEAKEQHRMAELIETSGESSQGVMVRKETSTKRRVSELIPKRKEEEEYVITLSSDEEDLQSMRDTTRGHIRRESRLSLYSIKEPENSRHNSETDDDCQPSTSTYMRR